MTSSCSGVALAILPPLSGWHHLQLTIGGTSIPIALDTNPLDDVACTPGGSTTYGAAFC